MVHRGPVTVKRHGREAHRRCSKLGVGSTAQVSSIHNDTFSSSLALTQHAGLSASLSLDKDTLYSKGSKTQEEKGRDPPVHSATRLVADRSHSVARVRGVPWNGLLRRVVLAWSDSRGAHRRW
jgi:hypothetical protein